MCKISCKIKEKNAFFATFRPKFEKNNAIFAINISKFIKCKDSCKEKNFEFETKVPCFCIFKPQLKKTIVVFEIGTFEFVKIQRFMLKTKS